MESIDRINVRRLVIKLKEDLTECFDADLFQPNNAITAGAAKKLIHSYLGGLVDQHAINDYKVEARIPTWEYYYPQMPVRLLAIEASERFGDVLPLTDDNIKRVTGYPYRRVDHYTVDDEEGTEYIGSSEHSPPPDEPYTTRSELVIDNPEHQLVVDLHIRPIEPIEYVTVSITGPEGFFDVD